jgi:hypothetical protein
MRDAAGDLAVHATVAYTSVRPLIIYQACISRQVTRVMHKASAHAPVPCQQDAGWEEECEGGDHQDCMQDDQGPQGERDNLLVGRDIKATDRRSLSSHP